MMSEKFNAAQLNGGYVKNFPKLENKVRAVVALILLIRLV